MYVHTHNKMRQLGAKEEQAAVIEYKMTSLFRIMGFVSDKVYINRLLGQTIAVQLISPRPQS